MSSTNPGGPEVIGGGSALILQEPAFIDERGRLRLLPRWIQRVPWLHKPAHQPVDALLLFKEPGLISLLEWAKHGSQIINRFEQIEKNAAEDEDALEALRLIQDRYAKLSIGSERRPSLGDAVLIHLGLLPDITQRFAVYVAVLPERIDIFSTTYRGKKLTRGHDLINDLP